MWYRLQECVLHLFGVPNLQTMLHVRGSNLGFTLLHAW